MVFVDKFVGLNKFLSSDGHKMRIMPSSNKRILILQGDFDFIASAEGLVEISDTYKLRITIKDNFPKSLPSIEEIGNKIPKKNDYHVNQNGTLCLGSPVRLLEKLSRHPTIQGFVKTCLIPYLYSMSHKLNHGSFAFGELEHYSKGVIQDYSDIFGLKSKAQVREVLICLSKKKRLANKLRCPCCCGLRLGKCKLRLKVNKYRKMASRFWFGEQLNTLKGD